MANMTYQASTVYTECWLEVGDFMEVMFEAVPQRVAVGADKIRLHFCLADHAIPAAATIVYYTVPS